MQVIISFMVFTNDFDMSGVILSVLSLMAIPQWTTYPNMSIQMLF